MSIIVQKFGGTSLASIKLIKNAALKIKDELDKNNKVVAVVSAMSNGTNELISLSNRLMLNESVNSKAEMDSIVSTGEQISAGLLAIALLNLGINARSFLAWQLDIKASNEKITSINTKLIEKTLNEDVVPVIAGFQGVDNNRIVTLGRGASDYSALLVASKIGASRCDLFTDVDGVFTADPKLVNTARKLKNISYEEMYEMASLGSKVVHSSAVTIAKDHKLKVRILSSFSSKQDSTMMGVARIDDIGKVRGITSKNIGFNKSLISLIGTQLKQNYNLHENIKNILQEKQILIDNIYISDYKVSIEIQKNILSEVTQLLHECFCIEKVCVN